jgi:hypothetical protein
MPPSQSKHPLRNAKEANQRVKKKMNANQQPKMMKQKDLRRLMKKRLLLKVQDRAATKIQMLVRNFLQKRRDEWERYYEEQDAYEHSYGCDCGDWLCTGCGEGPYISCCRCGADCRGGDYEGWRICSRRCLVRDD